MSLAARSGVLIGQSQAMRELRALIERVAPTQLPVLIEGETGTGKELVAELLHRASGRRGSLVAFNVCAIGESMFEDALFGHVRGAYTGAINDALGFLRESNGGTVFFDEISALPMPQQAKLLRAIDTGVFRPIGAARDVHSDFRVVAATNELLTDAVSAGRFRADLRHRLSGIVVRVPPLTERSEDIPELATHFLRECIFGNRHARIDDRAARRLMLLPWQGNVRELKSVIQAAAAFADDVLDLRALESALGNRAPVDSGEGGAAHSRKRSELIVALHDAGWDVSQTAERLGVHRVTVYRQMRQHGIQPPRFAGL
ncbi:MAG TPA: sigma 54-interacting transcriptional regulator [Gemmatimonadaceae bacterium]|jgi:DNA-binding NtrC family response regulator|nr:sigma 54-interacting transcriptional regulator [Gemmatimonadaceae bacterium]